MPENEGQNTVLYKPLTTPIRFGIDVGSSTGKVAALNDKDELLYSAYVRHRADIRSTIIKVVNDALADLQKKLPDGENQIVSVKVTGSGGLAVSQ